MFDVGRRAGRGGGYLTWKAIVVVVSKPGAAATRASACRNRLHVLEQFCDVVPAPSGSLDALVLK